MEKQEWLKAYDESYPKFKWFIEKYFSQNLIERLKKARERGDVQELDFLLNEIWFELPDNKFNIVENPVGWTEFLNLLEE